MGKGDRKTAKGKRFMGSHGKTRPNNSHKSNPVIIPKKVKEKAKSDEPVVEKKTAKAPAKKAAPKKTTASKTATTKDSIAKKTVAKEADTDTKSD